MKDRLLAIGIILFSLFYWYFFWQVNHQEPPKGSTNFNGLFLPAEVRVGYEPEIIISGNCIIAVSPSVIPAREIRAVITSYRAVWWETDNTPCISASGMNICETDKKICANNCYSFGTPIEIDGEIWEVQDRMNKRYGCNHIDLLMDKRIKETKIVKIY